MAVENLVCRDAKRQSQEKLRDYSASISCVLVGSKQWYSGLYFDKRYNISKLGSEQKSMQHHHKYSLFVNEFRTQSIDIKNNSMCLLGEDNGISLWQLCLWRHH